VSVSGRTRIVERSRTRGRRAKSRASLSAVLGV
jgi:hypothetical protein